MLMGRWGITFDPRAVMPLLFFVRPRATFARPSPIFQRILPPISEPKICRRHSPVSRRRSIAPLCRICRAPVSDRDVQIVCVEYRSCVYDLKHRR
jgi:hypothetical protein